MALDPKKWTTKTQEAMAAAIDQAKANSHPQLTPDHVLVALTGQDDTIDPAEVDGTVERLQPFDALLRSPGVMGPAIEPADDADPQTRLLNFLGRQP